MVNINKQSVKQQISQPHVTVIASDIFVLKKASFLIDIASITSSFTQTKSMPSLQFLWLTLIYRKKIDEGSRI